MNRDCGVSHFINWPGRHILQGHIEAFLQVVAYWEPPQTSVSYLTRYARQHDSFLEMIDCPIKGGGGSPHEPRFRRNGGDVSRLRYTVCYHVELIKFLMRLVSGLTNKCSTFYTRKVMQ
jgi:hypothetical protein